MVNLKWLWVLAIFLILASQVHAYTSIYITDLSDSRVNISNPNANYDTQNLRGRTYIKWNITPLYFNNGSIPLIESAVWRQGLTCDSCDRGSWNDTLYLVKNQTWTEQTITWNNQPCDAINNLSKCSPYLFTSLNPVPDGYSVYVNLTNMLKDALNLNYSNFSTEATFDDYNCFYSDKEFTGFCDHYGLWMQVNYSACNPSLTCGSWSSCSNSSQSRSCSNGCGDNSTENRSCIMPYSSNQTTSFCYDNNTLLTNYVYVVDGVEHNYLLPTLCLNGCDNITTSCNPAKYEQDLFNFLMIVIIIGIGVIFIAWLRKRR